MAAAPAATIDDAETGALALEGVLESVEAVLPDSLESAVQDKIPTTVSRLTANATTA